MQERNKYIKEKYAFSIFVTLGEKIFERFNLNYYFQKNFKLRNKLLEINSAINIAERVRIHWSYRFGAIPIILLIFVILFLSTGGDISCLIFSVAIGFCILYIPENKLNKQIEEKKLSIQNEFPEFANRLAILLNTGMTTSKAWMSAYKNALVKTPFKNEILITLEELATGKSEAQVYEEFARRCKNSEVTRFISVLIQNLKKGNSELVAVIKIQAAQCWEMRKNAARRRGEEASVKMLLPMTLMFCAVLIVVAIPGILALMTTV